MSKYQQTVSDSSAEYADPFSDKSPSISDHVELEREIGEMNRVLWIHNFSQCILTLAIKAKFFEDSLQTFT